MTLEQVQGNAKQPNVTKDDGAAQSAAAGPVIRTIELSDLHGFFAHVTFLRAPVVLLQSVIAYTFMERHWQLVTKRLSAEVTADVAALIDIYESYPQDDQATVLGRIAEERLGMDVEILPDTDLPAPGTRPFFSLLDSALSAELAQQVKRPFWLDTVGRSSLIEIRIKLGKDVTQGHLIPWLDFMPKWKGLQSLGLSPDTIFTTCTTICPPMGMT